MKFSVFASILAVAALAAGGSPVLAGAHVGAEVTLGPAYAAGAMAAVRNSSDIDQFIGCQMNGYPGGAFLGCSAKDRNGTNVFCYTYDVDTIAAARALDDESYVEFSWNKTGQCTGISVQTNSAYKP